MSLTINNGQLNESHLEPNESASYTFTIVNSIGSPEVTVNSVTTTINPNCFVGINKAPLSGVSLGTPNVTYTPTVYNGITIQLWTVKVEITTQNASPAPSLDLIDVAVDYEYNKPTDLSGAVSFPLSAD